MSKATNALKCDGCGRFIANAEFERGASRYMVTPDSDYTREEYSTLCARCNRKESK